MDVTDFEKYYVFFQTCQGHVFRENTIKNFSYKYMICGISKKKRKLDLFLLLLVIKSYDGVV